jgi:hypothetical protein
VVPVSRTDPPYFGPRVTVVTKSSHSHSHTPTNMPMHQGDTSRLVGKLRGAHSRKISEHTREHFLQSISCLFLVGTDFQSYIPVPLVALDEA